jgi:hypothetical protein
MPARVDLWRARERGSPKTVKHTSSVDTSGDPEDTPLSDMLALLRVLVSSHVLMAPRGEGVGGWWLTECVKDSDTFVTLLLAHSAVCVCVCKAVCAGVIVRRRTLPCRDCVLVRRHRHSTSTAIQHRGCPFTHTAHSMARRECQPTSSDSLSSRSEMHVHAICWQCASAHSRLCIE